jgi:hypothetical protein
MNSQSEMNIYDYSNSCSAICGFSHFTDDKEFKYGNDGDICISTNSSTWAKKLLNNMRLDDYLESESFVPPPELTFPNFGTRDKPKKGVKESVGNYIESCELCQDSLEKGAHRLVNIDNKLVCFDCFDYVNNKSHMCFFCKCQPTHYYTMFLNGSLDLTEQIHDENNYCKDCIKKLFQTQRPTYYLFGQYILNQYEDQPYEQDEYQYEYQQDEQEEYQQEDVCLSCGEYNTDGGICYYCRVNRFSI